jgi:hypothetical protein
MPYGFPSVPTAQMHTKGPMYHEDPYDTTKPMKGATNPLGSACYWVDTGGRTLKFRYVRLNSTAAPGTLYNGPVFYKDNTFTIITAVGSEGFGVANLVAGVLMNTSLTNGDYTWILVAGYSGASSDAGWGTTLTSTTSVAAGDGVAASGTAQGVIRVTAGSPTYRLAYIALTTSNTAVDGWVVCEDFGTA